MIDYQFGPRFRPGAGTEFRLWAPDHGNVEIVLLPPSGDTLRLAMTPQPNGFHKLAVADAAPGWRYQFLVDGEGPYPPLLDQVRRAYTSWRERDGVSSETVARAVVGAATDPTSPFRVLIGDDAAAMNAAMRAYPDDAFTAWWFDYVGIRWPADP